MHDFKEICYKQLTPTERFNLALAAFSRGDDDEIARLKRTCPQKTYKMMDLDYFGKIEGIVWVVTQFSEICEHNYHHITLCEAYISIFTFLDAQPQYTNEETKHHLEKFHDEKINHISNLKSAYQALAEFCVENQLNCDHVIQWLKMSPQLASQYDNYIRLEIDLNKDFTAYVKQKLFSIWHRDVLSVNRV